MATSGSKTRRGSRRKSELLAVSGRLFQELGFHNVSMDAIAAEVGITGPALYRHFRNKQDILVQALTEQLEQVERLTREALADDVPDDARLDHLLRGLTAIVLDQRVVLLWKRERTHIEEPDRGRFRRRVRAMRDEVTEILRAERTDLDGPGLEFIAWGLLSIYDTTPEYRARLGTKQAALMLDRMAHAIASCDLTAAPSLPTSPWSARTPPPAARRERVLESATGLFAERGYYDVGMEEIAGASETAIATVYQLFSGKADILGAILHRAAEGTVFITHHRLAAARDPADALSTIIDTYLELALGPHGRVLRILGADAVYLPDEAKQGLRRTEREHVEEWTRALIRVRPELSEGEALVLVATAIGLIGDLAQIPSSRKRPELGGELLHLVTTLLLATRVD